MAPIVLELRRHPDDFAVRVVVTGQHREQLDQVLTLFASLGYVTDDKVYCVYLAPDEQTIREHARKSGIPANRISAVRRLIDPASLS